MRLPELGILRNALHVSNKTLDGDKLLRVEIILLVLLIKLDCLVDQVRLVERSLHRDATFFQKAFFFIGQERDHMEGTVVLNREICIELHGWKVEFSAHWLYFMLVSDRLIDNFYVATIVLIFLVKDDARVLTLVDAVREIIFIIQGSLHDYLILILL